MRFLELLVLGIISLSNLFGTGSFHVSQPFDLNSNGNSELLVLNSKSSSASLVEISANNKNVTIWSYSIPKNGKFADAEIVDINNDMYPDIILIPDLYASAEMEDWVYIFLGNENGFSEIPVTLSGPLLDFSTIRPSNLSLVSGGNLRLAVSFGSPIRSGLLFDIDVSDNIAKIKNTKIISAPIINNGYGAVYVGGFVNEKRNYVALISPEKGKLKTAVFELKEGLELSYTQSISIGKSKNILGAGIQPFSSKTSDMEGLLVPFATDQVLLISIAEQELIVSNTNLSGKGAFPINDTPNLFSLVKKRSSLNVLQRLATISSKSKTRSEKPALLPPEPVLPDAPATLNSKKLTYDAVLTSRPEDEFKSYKYEEKNEQKIDRYSELSPTLTDFLRTVKDQSPKVEINEKNLISVPKMNEDMQSARWADEAGFTQLNLGEYISEEVENSTEQPSVPDMDFEISTFSKDSVLNFKNDYTDQDTSQIFDESEGVDLYYVLAITPVSNSKDRYVFDGEAPFGVSVNQIPSMGNATHLQHGISADFSTLDAGEVYDFAYSMRDARLDSITTLTMVHDLQTNVVFMSIKPTEDSISQSYQPESFDPKLFEFPNYFFEGFPNSLDMDFTDKLIRFTFQEDRDSTYKGIYLSSTTPSIPSQSLAVFMDQGILQSIRGEVVVRANRSKKVTTEFDLVGSVEPDVLFSRLIEEMFPEELKIRLLQGASLEEPLFGPSGKLPKITKEPRLPRVDANQVETTVPIEPKTSSIPETFIDTTSIGPDSSSNIPFTQEDEISPQTLELEKRNEQDILTTDTLKLEKTKEVKSADDTGPPSPDESQVDQSATEKPVKQDVKNQSDTKTDASSPEESQVDQSATEKPVKQDVKNQSDNQDKK